MATPITHLFFANKFCNKHPEIDRFPFFAGNCLPDIRYIDKNIPRAKFHLNNITINSILWEKSDFWKGVKFHSFIDKYYQKKFAPYESDPTFMLFLKFLEDDILYSKLTFLQDFIKFFTKYNFPTKDINEESIEKWKSILCNYFSLQPCNSSRKNFILWIGLTNEIYNQIESMLRGPRQNYISNFNDMISFIEDII